MRIYPTDEQMGFFARQVGCCRLLYNTFVDFFHNGYVDNKKRPNEKEIYRRFQDLKVEKPFINEVYTRALAQTHVNFRKAVERFYDALKEGKTEPIKKFGKPTGWFTFEPKFHRKGVHDSFRVVKNTVTRISGNRISIFGSMRNVLFSCSRKDMRYLNRHQNLIKSVTVRRAPSGRYFATVQIDDLRIKPLPASDKMVGIDLGIKDALIMTDGETVEKVGNKHFKIGVERRIGRLQRAFKRRQKDSKRREKVRLARARLEERVANRRKNFWHQLSTRIVRENQAVGIEDLNVGGMMKNPHLAKHVNDVSWSEFRRQLEYKCKWYGRELVVVDRFFPTSQTCSNCGFKNSAVKNLSVREWTCPKCGHHHDRDANAALNILQKVREHMVGTSSPEPIRTGTGHRRGRMGNSPSRRPGRTVKTMGGHIHV